MDIVRFILFYTCTHFTCVTCSVAYSQYAGARMTALKSVNLRMGLRNSTNVEHQNFEEHLEKPIPNLCICSQIYDPICGSNGLSYFNRCRMECDLGPNHGISVVHQGNCIPYK